MTNIFNRLFSGRKSANNIPTSAGFRFIGGQLIPYKQDKLTYIERGYTYNDIIYSIIKKILEKAVVPTWGMYKVQDEKGYNNARALFKKISTSKDTSQDYKAAMQLLSKSLIKIEDDPFIERLKYPNENETFSELNYGLWGYKLITGDYYEAGWDSGASGGLTAGVPLFLYSLPSQYTSITASDRLPLTESGYLLQCGTEIRFTKEDILHERYFNPEWDIYGSQLYGMSPMKAYLMRLQRNNMGQIRQMKMAQNGGADVVVYLDDARITGEDDYKLAIDQSSKLKAEWNAEQKGINNAGSAVWSPFKLGSTRLGLTAIEMDLLEAAKFDLTMAALIYNAPPVLFSTDASTYNNQNTGERSLTANCAIPLILAREASINRKLQTLPRYKGSNMVISPDLSCYTELEESKKDQVAWLKDSLLPMSRKYEIMGEDRPQGITEDEWNAILIPSGYSLLSELFAQPNDLSGDMRTLQDNNANPYETT